MSILFTFQARPHEEYSSDSFDSDYYPGRESSDEDMEKLARARRHHIKNRKRKKATSSKSSQPKRKLRKLTQDNDASNKTDDDDDNQFHLPPEVMVKIFKYVIQDVGFTNCIPSVARVCKEWNKVASDASMLDNLDLSVSKATLLKKNHTGLMKLLKRDISHCQLLNLHGQVNLAASTIEQILNLIPRVKTLDLHTCSIKPDVVRQIPQLCPLIQRIILTGQVGTNAKNTMPAIEALIKGLGENLVELRLANFTAVFQNPGQVLKVIQESCQKLEVLDISVSFLMAPGHFVTDTEGLARGCPRLREIYFDGFNILDKTKKLVNGFKNLQVYSQSSQIHYDREEPAFYRLFSQVSKLMLLNVSRSRLLPSLISQWVKEVEELYLQDMNWTDSEEREVIHCAAAWCMSLKTLDLSFNKPKGLILDLALSQYGNTNHSDGYPLQFLNLSHSNVTPKSVIHVIKACKNLQEINLTSCRELPRGTKRDFKKEEFSSLLKSLDSSL